MSLATAALFALLMLRRAALKGARRSRGQPVLACMGVGSRLWIGGGQLIEASSAAVMCTRMRGGGGRFACGRRVWGKMWEGVVRGPSINIIERGEARCVVNDPSQAQPAPPFPMHQNQPDHFRGIVPLPSFLQGWGKIVCVLLGSGSGSSGQQRDERRCPLFSSTDGRQSTTPAAAAAALWRQSEQRPT
jgi:hypothetical protein